MIDLHDELVTALAGRYEIERELGRGGMAIVYLARDLRNQRRVALKVLRPELSDALGGERFLQEIAVSAPLVHPNIIALYDSGEASGFLYYTMPYVDGPTLRQRLDREVQLPIDDAVAIARQVAAALDHAHAQGLVHRDIKPDNILLLGDHVLVADFGLARAITRSASKPLTTQGLIVGTPPYMSPEQCTPNSTITSKSDIYSLACVVFEMIAGVTPFRSATTDATIAHHLSSDPPSLCAERRSCPSTLDVVVRRGLAKSPADRFKTAGEFASALATAGPVRIDESNVRPPVPPEPSPNRTIRAAIAAGILTLVVAGGFFVKKQILDEGLHRNDWVLVADFTGPPDDARLADAFRDLATTALAQSRFVRLLDRRQLNEVMNHAGVAETTHVNVELGRQLAQRSSVRAVLLGSIQRLGDDYSIALHVVGADDGAAIASATGIAQGPDWQHTLVTAVEERVKELRLRLGERRSDIAANRPLRDVATPSFDAFRKYSAALDRVVTHGDFAGSSTLLHEAIALDSGFAAAWITLGANYQTARQLDSARIAFAHALALPQRLSLAESYRLKGDAAYALDQDLSAAVKWYDLYLAEQPLSRSGRSNRALYRSALGHYEEALADLDEAVALNPFGPQLIQPTLLNQAAMLVVLGRTDDATKVLNTLTGSIADYVRMMLASAAGRWPELDSISARVANDASTQGVFRINAITSRASALAAEGAVVAADSVLRAAAATVKGSTARWYERERLLLALTSGMPILPRTDLVAQDTTPAAEALRGLWAGFAGDTVRARSALAALANVSPRTRGVVGASPVLIESTIAARAGRWTEVTRLLGLLALNGEHNPTVLDRPDSYLLRWVVADAYERLGRPDSAIVYLDLMLRPIRVPPGHLALRGISFGFVHHRLALLHERRHDPGAARRHLDAFLAAFIRADPVTTPMVAAARTTRGRLTKLSRVVPQSPSRIIARGTAVPEPDRQPSLIPFAQEITHARRLLEAHLWPGAIHGSGEPCNRHSLIQSTVYEAVRCSDSAAVRRRARPG